MFSRSSIALQFLFTTARKPHQSYTIVRMASTLPRLALFEAISKHDPKSAAVIHCNSQRTFTYGEVLHDVLDTKNKIQAAAGDTPIDGQRIGFLVENSYDYVVTLLSILGSNAIAMPLSSGFPASELRYILDNSQAAMLLASSKYESQAQTVLREGLEKTPIFVALEKRMGGSTPGGTVELHENEDDQGGMMLYTSGTTSRPKGVLLPNSALTAQCQSLIEAWKYTPSDHLLHVLPLHHIHGTVNALLTPLMAGSSTELMFPFNAKALWERLAMPFGEQSSQPPREPVTFLTVVPTIYNRLLSSFPDLPEPVQAAAKEAISPKHLRVNISGSAALPTPTKQAWSELSGGNVLLERYGMTEVGMALSCGLDTADRVDGSVGWPLPLVEARLVDSETQEVIAVGEETTADGKEREGEIQLRGPTVFKEYWRNEKATAEEFVDASDGKGRWFKTGDVAVRRSIDGAGKSDQNWARGPMYFIRGRKSVDIIKSGGEKVSALEIEREMLSLPQIAECAVVGVPSEQWGQKVAAIVVLDPQHANTGKGGKQWGIMDMRRALKERLVNYKIPQEFTVVDSIPRNAMGKINKKNLVKEVFGDEKFS